MKAPSILVKSFILASKDFLFIFLSLDFFLSLEDKFLSVSLILRPLISSMNSYTQSLDLGDRWDDKVFLILYIVSNLILF